MDILAGRARRPAERILDMARHAVLLVLVPLFVAACADTGADAPDTKPLAVINMTAGAEDAHRAWMGLRLAEHFLAHGHDVIVFLNVGGPPLASKGLAETTRFEDKPAFREQIALLTKGGAKILVCQECAEKTGVSSADLLPGVAFADRDSLFGGLNERTVVFSY
jgi:predicted peroxiredoxin